MWKEIKSQVNTKARVAAIACVIVFFTYTKVSSLTHSHTSDTLSFSLSLFSVKPKAMRMQCEYYGTRTHSCGILRSRLPSNKWNFAMK